jgi:hypothetical protein
MKTSTVTITPAMASDWLKKNTSNRDIRESWVDYLTEQIKSGHWDLTHQGIAFAKSSQGGHLLDGQHRLLAIVKANKSVQMQVTIELDKDTFKVIDVAKSRTHFDRVNLVTNKVANKMICQIVTAYLRHAKMQRGAVPISKLEDVFLEFCDSFVWVASRFPMRSNDGVSRAAVLAALAIYHSKRPMKAQAFAVGLKSGADLPAGSPILAIRRAIPKLGPTSGENYWRTVSAIKAYDEGRALTSVYEASEDLLGNKNSYRVLAEKQEKGLKGAATRKARAEKLA